MVAPTFWLCMRVTVSTVAALPLAWVLFPAWAKDPVWEASSWNKHSDGGTVLFEPEAAFGRAGAQCYVYGKHVAVVEEFKGGVGNSTFLHQRKAKLPARDPAHCDAPKAQALMTIPPTDGNYFAGVHGERLFIDTGTGMRRKLSIYAIPGSSPVKVLDYDGEGFKVEAGQLVDRFFRFDGKRIAALPEKVPPCPPRTAEQADRSQYVEQVRGTLTVSLQDLSEKPESVRCEITYEE
jgi:hypothetical protein